MYVDNANQEIKATDVTLTSAIAGVSGGAFYFANVGTVTIEKVTSGGTFTTLEAPTHGSFLCSEATTLDLYLTDLVIGCKTTDITYSSDLSGKIDLGTDDGLAGAFYISQAVGVTSSGNVF